MNSVSYLVLFSCSYSFLLVCVCVYVYDLDDGFRPEFSCLFKCYDIVVLTFDVTKKESLERCDEILKVCLELMENDPDCHFVFVAFGTKIDLVDQREVTEEFARQHFASKNPSIEYFEVSSKTGEGVAEAFESAVRLYYRNNPKNDNKTEKEERGGCDVM